MGTAEAQGLAQHENQTQSHCHGTPLAHCHALFCPCPGYIKRIRLNGHKDLQNACRVETRRSVARRCALTADHMISV